MRRVACLALIAACAAAGLAGCAAPDRDNDAPPGASPAPSQDPGAGALGVRPPAGNQTCPVLDEAGVKCWGQNDPGGLALGNQTT